LLFICCSEKRGVCKQTCFVVVVVVVFHATVIGKHRGANK
jgi:hypothetical protein